MSSATATARAGATREQVEGMVRAVLTQSLGRVKPGSAVVGGGVNGGGVGYRPKLVVNISARHMHLAAEHVEALFGAGAKLTEMRRLYQDTDFAANETVAVVGPRQRMIPGVRVLGPCRKETQVELSFTDAISLGIEVPVRLSGDTEGSPGCVLIGPKGHVVLERGVIRAERHVHMGLRDAEYYGVKHLDRMHLEVEGPCPTALRNLLVRTHPDWKLEVHIDTDEANACDLPHAARVSLVKA